MRANIEHAPRLPLIPAQVWARLIATPWHVNPKSGCIGELTDDEAAMAEQFRRDLAELVTQVVPWLPAVLISAKAALVADGGRLWASYPFEDGAPVTELSGLPVDLSGLPWPDRHNPLH